jgi:hypothetical protein
MCTKFVPILHGNSLGGAFWHAMSAEAALHVQMQSHLSVTVQGLTCLANGQRYFNFSYDAVIG